MLRQLLDIIRCGEITSQVEIAAHLGIRLETLNAMLQQLERLGYLQTMNPTCGTACAHCDIKSGCAPQVKFWELTEKGQGAG